MKAMILAAGLGTRLRPLTEKKPKALVPVVNTPIISRSVEYLKKHGINNIIVNSHHHYQQLLDYIDHGRPFSIDMEVRVELEILGTGGGIKNCSDFWGKDTFLVINSDILTDIDLGRAFEYHRLSGNPVTLILHDYTPFNQISIDNRSRITGISPRKSRDSLAFTGIHILEPDVLSYIPESGYSDIIDCYRRLISSGAELSAYVSENHYWRDIGNPESYVDAHKEILSAEGKNFDTGPGSIIDPSTSISDWAVIGANSRVEKDVKICRSILWDDVYVKEGVNITDCIVTSSSMIDRDLKGKIC